MKGCSTCIDNVMAKDFMPMLDSLTCLLSTAYRAKVHLQSNHSVSMQGADTGETMWSFHTKLVLLELTHAHKPHTVGGVHSCVLSRGMVQEILQIGKKLRDIGNVASGG